MRLALAANVVSVRSFFGGEVKGVLGQQGPLEAAAAAAVVVVAPELLALLQVEVRGEQVDGW